MLQEAGPLAGTSWAAEGAVLEEVTVAAGGLALVAQLALAPQLARLARHHGGRAPPPRRLALEDLHSRRFVGLLFCWVFNFRFSFLLKFPLRLLFKFPF